jgi:hypothetical protein
VKEPSEMTDEELSEAVALEVMGWSKSQLHINPSSMITRGGAGYRYWKKSNGKWGAAPRFAVTQKQAFKVIEKLRERVCLLLRTVHDQSEHRWVVELWGLHSTQYESHGIKAYAAWLPRAICLVALQAVRAGKVKE